MGEISLGENITAPQHLEELSKNLPSGVQVTMVRKEGRNYVPSGDLAVAAGDGLFVIADQEDAIAETARRLGRLEPGRIVKDRRDLDYIRVFVGKAGVVGVPLSKLPLPAGFSTHILHVRRYDADLVPTPDLTLEFGDRIGVLLPPERKEEIRRFFGDTVKSTAEFSYVSLGIGMVLGVLLELIPIPIPGVGTVTLGIAGGPLIVALILGKLRRTGPMLGSCPSQPILCFGISGSRCFSPPSGKCRSAFCANCFSDRSNTTSYRRCGAADDGGHLFARRLLPPQDPVRRSCGRGVGRYRESGDPGLFDAHGAHKRPDIGYAMIFPSMTIVKVVAVQIVGLLAATGTGEYSSALIQGGCFRNQRKDQMKARSNEKTKRHPPRLAIRWKCCFALALPWRAQDRPPSACGGGGCLGTENGINSLTVSITLNSIIASVRRGSERAISLREIEPPIINASRIGAFEQLAQMVGFGFSQHDITIKLAEIEATAPAYSLPTIAVMIGTACGGFAFLNGAGMLEVMAAAIAGAAGQAVRAWLSRRQLTQYAVAALCALLASAIYSLIAFIAVQVGLGLEHHTSGPFASVLFLVPGFPLVAALLDLLKYQTAAAITVSHTAR